MEAAPIVLVVEDEMVLRMRAVDIVEDAGFTAVEATSADQALGILESRDDIALVFSDIQMPGSMDGLELAQIVHRRWPEIKIVLVSGKVEVTDADKPLLSLFFPKPLEVAQMVVELRNMISPALTENDALATENDALKMALEQAGVDAQALVDQAGVAADEREAAAKLQSLINAELHHRIKNLLGTVAAITHQSIRTASSLETANSAIDGRFAALVRAHDLLTKVSWETATIDDTVRSAVAPFDGARFAIKGRKVSITSSSVIAFAMTLNELCTNAAKFGALSCPQGKVSIAWAVKAKRFKLEWVESGGPPVHKPTHKSFGTRMMTSLGQQLNGTVDLNYEPSGFIYTLDVPVGALVKGKDK